ncbi:MAG: NAD+ synthase [Nitrospinae bacterium]|nr:NAD+ synthase [Nitrospinota bacterium]
MIIGIVQGNPVVGDVEGNLEKAKNFILEGDEKGADLILFPELFITGYPPEDLLYNPAFLEKSQKAVMELQFFSKSVKSAIIIGAPNAGNGYRTPDSLKGQPLYNSAIVFHNGEYIAKYDKIYLPNYGVFDEKRYFIEGRENQTGSIFTLKGIKFGLTICEDIWSKRHEYFDPLKECDIILNLSSSPFYQGKFKERIEVVSSFARHFSKKLVYANLVGGQDELVFDGNSMVCNEKGEVTAFYPAFEEGLFFYNTEEIVTVKPERKKYADILEALKLGLKDYVSKNGFNKVVVGLSGGIDSALTAAVAVLALGKENVKGVMMPSKFSSEGSVTDSVKLAENIGIETFQVPIENVFGSFEKELHPVFKDKKPDITEENLQARIRGVILMAFSNKFNWLLLTTGNKSEVSVGYCTLYGDMAGGFSLIKDVLKTDAYKLSEFINETYGELIPQEIIIKEPSAELRENQKDSDSLPEYPVLDKILTSYIEERKTVREICEEMGNEAQVRKIINLVMQNEYKRRQAAPGIKLTPLAFGKDRRVPMTNRFYEK